MTDVTNTLAHCGTELITAVKRFIIVAPEVIEIFRKRQKPKTKTNGYDQSLASLDKICTRKCNKRYIIRKFNNSSFGAKAEYSTHKPKIAGSNPAPSTGREKKVESRLVGIFKTSFEKIDFKITDREFNETT